MGIFWTSLSIRFIYKFVGGNYTQNMQYILLRWLKLFSIQSLLRDNNKKCTNKFIYQESSPGIRSCERYCTPTKNDTYRNQLTKIKFPGMQ